MPLYDEIFETRTLSYGVLWEMQRTKKGELMTDHDTHIKQEKKLSIDLYAFVGDFTKTFIFITIVTYVIVEYGVLK